MTGPDLVLHPFAPLGPSSSFEITGAVSRLAQDLFVEFTLRGPLDALEMPAPAAVPERRSGLWEGTCFELFLAPKAAPGYWEFNLSPAGHWNVFRFSAYRRHMTEETAFSALPFSVGKRSGALSVALTLDLDRIGPPGQNFSAGLSAVTRHRGGARGFWALSHPGPRPDFHHPEAFILAL